MNKQRGVALVLVLLILLLLGVIASSHVKNVRVESLLVAREVDAAGARALCAAGTELAILGLLTRGDAPWPLDGTVVPLLIGERSVSLAVRDASGLVDLNSAGPDVLRLPILAAGVEGAAVEALVDAILDWRDVDDTRRRFGAEDGDYLAAGLEWTARDGAFRNVDELAHVYGMTGRLFVELAPFVTVHAQRGGLNADFAPPRLVKALAEADPAGARRASADARRRGTGVYHIYVSAELARGGASLETVVQITGDRRRPYVVLSTTEPMRVPFPDIEETQP